MIRNSLFVSMTALILIAFSLMKRLAFLTPWKSTMFQHCGPTIALFLLVLGLNLFAASLAINRKLLLKDTGRKLAHFDNQIQTHSPEFELPNFLQRH